MDLLLPYMSATDDDVNPEHTFFARDFWPFIYSMTVYLGNRRVLHTVYANTQRSVPRDLQYKVRLFHDRIKLYIGAESPVLVAYIDIIHTKGGVMLKTPEEVYDFIAL